MHKMNHTPPGPQLAATDTDKDNLIKSAAKRSIQFTEHDLMNKGSENEVELTYGTKVQDVKRNKHET